MAIFDRYDIKRVLSKVSYRENRWIQSIKKMIDPLLYSWHYHVTLLLREDRVEYARDKLEKDINVSVISLKEVNSFLDNGEFEGKNSLKN